LKEKVKGEKFNLYEKTRNTMKKMFSKWRTKEGKQSVATPSERSVGFSIEMLYFHVKINQMFCFKQSNKWIPYKRKSFYFC
jgi:hypothetical protein